MAARLLWCGGAAVDEVLLTMATTVDEFEGDRDEEGETDDWRRGEELQAMLSW